MVKSDKYHLSYVIKVNIMLKPENVSQPGGAFKDNMEYDILEQKDEIK